MSKFDLLESEKFQEENRKQQELNDAALATNDDAVIEKRAKDAWNWIQTSPYSPKNFGLIERAEAILEKLKSR